MYGIVSSKPDLAHVVSVVSRFMTNHERVHREALKWVLKYLNGTVSSGLMYRQSTQNRDTIDKFVSIDYARNVDTKMSLSLYAFTLFGTTVWWKFSLQSIVTSSTIQIEYIAFTKRVKEVLLLKRMIGELDIEQVYVTIDYKSQSVIHLANHQIYHEMTKHINIRLHFVISIVESKEVKIGKIAWEMNPKGLFSKSLLRSMFKWRVELINFCLGKMEDEVGSSYIIWSQGG